MAHAKIKPVNFFGIISKRLNRRPAAGNQCQIIAIIVIVRIGYPVQRFCQPVLIRIVGIRAIVTRRNFRSFSRSTKNFFFSLHPRLVRKIVARRGQVACTALKVGTGSCGTGHSKAVNPDYFKHAGMGIRKKKIRAGSILASEQRTCCSDCFSPEKPSVEIQIDHRDREFQALDLFFDQLCVSTGRNSHPSQIGGDHEEICNIVEILPTIFDHRYRTL